MHEYLGLILLAVYLSAEPSDLSLIPRILLQQLIVNLFLFLLRLVEAAIIHVLFAIKSKEVAIKSENQLVFVLFGFP